MAWVMKSTKRGSGFDITIGAMRIARIQYYGDNVVLWTLAPKDKDLPATTQFARCASVSDAFKKIHEMLNNPPEE